MSLRLVIEIDSVLPPLEPRGYKVKTVKLRGQISQGLAIPIDNFYQLGLLDYNTNYSIGECLDEIIGVKHIDELEISRMDKSKPFPGFLRKTDQIRIQNLEREDYINGKYEVSIKLDGSSMTVFYNNGQFGICSRNRLLAEEDNSCYSLYCRKNCFKEILTRYCITKERNLAIQGELIGEGIQGNKEKIKGYEFFVFDIWDITKQAYLSPIERYSVLADLGMHSVPIINDEEFFHLDDKYTLDSILKMAEGKSLHSKNREGIVFKSSDGTFSFKYLLG